MRNRIYFQSRIKWFICFVALLSIFEGRSFSEEHQNFESTMQKIQEYSHGVNLGMKYDEVLAIFGPPGQKEVLKDQQGLIIGIWQLKGYVLDASFEHPHNKLVSFGLHWFGNKSSLPNFKAILKMDFDVKEKKKTRIVHLENAHSVIHWEIKPIPGASDDVISVLTVSEK